MANREQLSCGPEYIVFLHSTLYNYYLCKLMQDFLNKKGNLLQVSPVSLEWDWANGYGLEPYDLVKDLLAKQFEISVDLIRKEEKAEYSKFFSKFPLGTIDEDYEFYIVNFPNKKFPTAYKFIEDKRGYENYYFGMYEEETKYHVASFDSTIVFAHRAEYVAELNYDFILRTIFIEMEGMEL